VFVDVGLSKIISDSYIASMTDPKGNMKYRAPELKKKNYLTMLNDVYSLGAVFFEQIYQLSDCYLDYSD